jgi:hypothetical protein
VLSAIEKRVDGTAGGVRRGGICHGQGDHLAGISASSTDHHNYRSSIVATGHAGLVATADKRLT